MNVFGLGTIIRSLCRPKYTSINQAVTLDGWRKAHRLSACFTSIDNENIETRF